MNKNRYYGLEYISAHLVWYILWALLYYKMLFKSVEGLSNKLSLMVLYAITIGISTVLGILEYARHEASNISINANLALSFGVYSYIIYACEISSVTFVLALFAISVLGLYVFKNYLEKKNEDKPLTSFLLNNTHVIAGLFAFSAMYLFIGSANNHEVNGISNHDSIKTSSEPLEEYNSDYYEHSLDQLERLFEHSTWENLSYQERLEIFQDIAYIEKIQLGIPFDITVSANVLDEDTLACYNHDTKQITISYEHLNSSNPWIICKSLCHEMRHSYQWTLIDLTSAHPEYANLEIFRNANISQLQWEFEHYESGDNPDAYYNQFCESDAREYSKEAKNLYRIAYEHKYGIPPIDDYIYPEDY